MRRFLSSQRNAIEVSLLVITLVLGAMIVLSQANPLTTKLGHDSGNYAYAASQMLQGKTLYVAVWNSKPPGVFFINALALWLGHGTRWGIWAIEFFSLLSTAAIGFYALQRRFGKGPALLASLAWLTGLMLTLEGGNYTEEYSLLFSFVCLLIFILTTENSRSSWMNLAFGAACGTSFLIRPNAIGVPASIMLTWIILAFAEKHIWETTKRLIVIGCGASMPFLVVSLYFASQHAFLPFLEGSFLYNVSYSAGHSNFASALSSGLLRLGPVAGIALVGVILAADSVRAQLRDRKIEPLLLWICVDSIIEIGMSGLSGRNYTHYLIVWLPWAAFACALVFNKVFPAFVQWSQKAFAWLPFLASAALAMIYASTLGEYAQGFRQLAEQRSPVQYDEPVARYVNEHSQPEDTVLVWGDSAAVNFLARREAPAPCILYPLLVPSKITDRLSAEFYQSLQSEPPVLIVDPAPTDAHEQLVPLSATDPVKWLAVRGVYAPPHLAEVFAFIHENYEYKTEVAGVAIYQLKGK